MGDGDEELGEDDIINDFTDKDADNLDVFMDDNSVLAKKVEEERAAVDQDAKDNPELSKAFDMFDMDFLNNDKSDDADDKSADDAAADDTKDADASKDDAPSDDDIIG